MNILFAVVCVVLFSLTVPATRVAALTLDPSDIAAFRLLGAGAVCALCVAFYDRWFPPRKIWFHLFAVAFGSVWGFSFLIALAMKQVPSTHGAIAMAATPALTAVYSSLRDQCPQSFRFWLFCLIGTASTFSYFFTTSSGTLSSADLLLVGVVVASTFGYVEGARLSRQYGGRRIMSWAVILALPLAIVLTLPSVHFENLPGFWDTPKTWAAVAYLATVSQSLGMFLWYRVLAIGPIGKIAMVQLLQPFLSLAATLAMLGEQISVSAWVTSGIVVLCIFGANNERQTPVKVDSH